MKMRVLVGVECVDALEYAREHERMAGGVSSGEICCKTEEEVDELRARQRGLISVCA
jgi:hypothetical protein